MQSRNSVKAKITELSMAELDALAAELAENGCLMALVGTPTIKPAPNGLSQILDSRAGGGTLGVLGGLTLRKSANAYTLPKFATRPSFVKKQMGADHFAEVLPTTTSDIVLDCFYVGPGDHIRPGMVTVSGRNRLQHVWRVSEAVSDAIRKGEEEHLADAARAFEITYKLIADTINAMGGKKYGPASNPTAAYALAEADLGSRLPKQLGVNPSTWIQVFDTLLNKTEERDKNGWHSLSTDPPKQERDKIVHVVSMSSANIGTVSATDLVNY